LGEPTGGIFHLDPTELPRLLAGEDLRPLIAARRKRRALALGLEAPRVLFSDDLEALGRPTTGVGCRAGAREVGGGVGSDRSDPSSPTSLAPAPASRPASCCAWTEPQGSCGWARRSGFSAQNFRLSPSSWSSSAAFGT